MSENEISSLANELVESVNQKLSAAGQEPLPVETENDFIRLLSWRILGNVVHNPNSPQASS